MTFFKVHVHLPFQTNNRYADYIDNEITLSIVTSRFTCIKFSSTVIID